MPNNPKTQKQITKANLVDYSQGEVNSILRFDVVGLLVWKFVNNMSR